MYTIQTDKNGEVEVLHCNNRPLFCPFKPTMLVPKQLSNQMAMHREPCGNWCPLFDYNQVDMLTLKCSNAIIQLTKKSKLV